MSKTTWKAVMVLLLFIVGVTAMRAQLTGAGIIQGTVADSKGAVIPDAKIHIVNTNTNVSHDTVTNSVGFYSVPSLFFGNYVVTVTANGMAQWETNLTLQAGQTAVIEAHMSIAGATAQVTVVADVTTPINTDNSTQDFTMTREQIEQIPMNQRQITSILWTSLPGYEGGTGNQPRVNGLVWGAFSWSEDGAPMDYRDGGGLDNIPPDPDIVQEVRVETSNSTAESDRPGYATYSTKSGTNHFHGTAYETNKDNSFGVAHNRQDSTSSSAPKLIRNEYGVSAGGPVILPWGRRALYNGKDKTFFFGAWNGMQLRQQNYGYFYVPTKAMKQGDFSGAVAANGTLYSVYDPNTTSSSANNYQRTQFAYNGKANMIDPNRESPLAKALWAVSPDPTNDGNPYTASAGNWQGALPNTQKLYGYTMRFDHRISEKDSVFFRYTLGHKLSNQWTTSAFGAPTTDHVWNGTFTPVDSQSGVLSWTHISSPTFYQTVVASMDYQSWKQQGSPAAQATQDVATSLGLENMFHVLGLPQIEGSNSGKSAGAQNSLLESFDQGSNSWRDSDYTNVFADNLVWVHGHHQVKFGGEYRHDQLRILPDQARSASVVFGALGTGNMDPKTTASKTYSAQQYTGLATADFFLGDVQSLTNYLTTRYLYLRDQETSVYVQDDIHLRNNLTLNVGIRYQAEPAIHERYNEFSSFDYANAAIVTGHSTTQLIAEGRTTAALVNAMTAIGVKFETPAQAGMPSGVFYNYWWNFLPRVGLAWMPFGDHGGLVVRGGYGQYAYKTPMRNIYGGFNQSVPYTSSYGQDFTNASQNDGYSNYILRAPQQPVVAGQNTTNIISVANSICNGCFGYTTLSPDQRPEGYREWNVTMQQNLRNHTAVSVAYLGNHGYNLEQEWYTNTAPTDYVWFETTGEPKPQGTYSRTAERIYNKTTYGEIYEYRKTGWANANMFQATFKRLYFKGFEYNVSWSYGKYFRAGGNTWRDSLVYMPAVFMPGTVPTDPQQANHFQNNLQDTGMPRNHIKYDWVLDLPVGQGRWLMPHANRLVDALIGGWELAGDGSMQQTLWQPSASDYGAFTALHTYGRSKPIKDCTNGANNCRKAYYAYNGYIQKSQYNTATGYQGLPGTFDSQLAGGAEHQPLNSTLANQVLPDPITLNNGTTVSNVTYAPGPTNALNKNYRIYLPNAFNFLTDASLFKTFKIKEGIGLKVNGDFFNVFNQQGTTGVNGTTGIISTSSSYYSARTVQLSARFSW